MHAARLTFFCIFILSTNYIKSLHITLYNQVYFSDCKLVRSPIFFLNVPNVFGSSWDRTEELKFLHQQKKLNIEYMQKRESQKH